MTIRELSHTEQAPAVGELVEDVDPIEATIRSEIQQAKARADEYAESASYHRQQATHLETLAMEFRTLERRWGRQLTALAAPETGDLLNDEGDVQTVLFPRRIYPYTHSSEGRIFLTCARCGRPTREATAEEVQEADAGLAVRHECDDCQHPAPRTLPYPPVAPDAA